jgi:hypothetical protein
MRCGPNSEACNRQWIIQAVAEFSESTDKLLKQFIPVGGRSYTPLKQGVNDRASWFLKRDKKAPSPLRSAGALYKLPTTQALAAGVARQQFEMI